MEVTINISVFGIQMQTYTVPEGIDKYKLQDYYAQYMWQDVDYIESFEKYMLDFFEIIIKPK